MSQKSYDDVPQHLKDKYAPKLTEAFNKVADIQERAMNDPQIAQDPDFLDEAAAVADNLETIATDFITDGGTEEELGLVCEKVLIDMIGPKP